MHRAPLVSVCSVLVLGLSGLHGLPSARAEPPASAETPAPAEPPAPVEPDRQAAEALFAEASELFQQWRFPEAEQKYREALTYSQHPVIHLYLSRTLDKQGDPVQAYEVLQQALRPGPEPLPPEDADLAEELRQELESRLAHIEVRCDQPGAEVLLDGEPWFTAPGPRRRVVRPGQHVLVARKPGYFPMAEAVSLIPGKQTRIEIRMSADVVHVERRWRPWLPWAVAGGGVVASAVGGLLLRQAGKDYEEFSDMLEACRELGGCDQVSTRARDRGWWREGLGTGGLIAGGAAVVVGLVGVLNNQPSTRRSEPGGSMHFELTPLISDDASGISAWIRF